MTKQGTQFNITCINETTDFVLFTCDTYKKLKIKLKETF